MSSQTRIHEFHPRPVVKASLARSCGLLLLTIGLLTGCGGGADTTSNPNLGGGSVAGVGGIPQSDLVQAFKREMWPNLSDKCGACHVQGGQDPDFARTDDINLAYNQAITVTNLSSPADSRLVSKVGAGHNCWLPDNSACADVMTTWIENWVGGSGSGGKTITLNPPAYTQPGASKQFPPAPGAFATTVWPLLTANCSGCHVENPPGNQLPIAPFFASSDVNAAYEAAKAKMDLNTPANSRFVIRLDPEGHNCWDPNSTGSTNCADSAAAMLTAISNFAGPITATPVTDPNASGGVMLADATVASGGNRYENDVIALYEFKQGPGATTIIDTSGVGTPINLTLSGSEGTDYEWVGGYGINFKSASAMARDQNTNSGRLQAAISASGEYSIEAWVIPANVTQEDANIVSYSGSATERNFTLGQTMYNYDFLHRSTTTDFNGMPAASTPDADEVLQASLQHVVVTFDPVNGRRIYVNGAVTNASDPVAPGGLGDWDGTVYPLILGNEQDGSRPWSGILKLVAIHERALTHQQIVQNFEVGVGEKYFMLFPISQISGVPPDSYIMFEFSQLDAHGYLFHSPTYVYLGTDTAFVPDFALQGMRIGVNGKLPTVGQGFSHVAVRIGDSNFDPATQQQLISGIGTVIASENGVDADEFYLAFDVIGAVTQPYVEPPVTAPTLVDPPMPPDVGIRVFAEINASMAAMTGVPVTNPAVRAVYQNYEQQLPSVENIDGFLGSHQMAIAQLALTYCSELVDGNGSISRDSYFAGFDFSASETTAFDTAAKRKAILDPLMLAAINADGISSNLTSQPAEAEIRDSLGAFAAQQLCADDVASCTSAYGSGYNSLIEQMLANCTGASCGTPARTLEIVKASCAAAVGGAVMLIQ